MGGGGVGYAKTWQLGVAKTRVSVSVDSEQSSRRCVNQISLSDSQQCTTFISSFDFAHKG